MLISPVLGQPTGKHLSNPSPLPPVFSYSSNIQYGGAGVGGAGAGVGGGAGRIKMLSLFHVRRQE